MNGSAELVRRLAEEGCHVEKVVESTFMGDTGFYAAMLAKLPANNCIAAMKDAIARRDVKALFEASHELKGVYATLGLTPLLVPCSAITETARAGSLAGTEGLLSILEPAHARVVAIAREQAEGGAAE